ncbi:MAG: hypothetical protein KDD13_00230 [Mangrovimonas sp.]|nr:hypothetical protein [Mangrovimonas sp.]
MQPNLTDFVTFTASGTRKLLNRYHAVQRLKAILDENPLIRPVKTKPPYYKSARLIKPVEKSYEIYLDDQWELHKQIRRFVRGMSYKLSRNAVAAIMTEYKDNRVYIKYYWDKQVQEIALHPRHCLHNKIYEIVGYYQII